MGTPFPSLSVEQCSVQDVTCASRESQAGCAQAGLVLSPALIYGEKPRCSQIWAGFGGGLNPDTSLLPCFPSPPSLQFPALFPHPLHFPSPRRGFCLLPSQGLGRGGVDAAQAGGAHGPARPQKVGAGVAPRLLRKEEWKKLICLLGFKNRPWKEGGRGAAGLCHTAGARLQAPSHPLGCLCFSGSLKMLAKTKGRTISWGTWSFA